MSANPHGLDASPIPRHVRDAVAEVVRDARDALDEPFEGELAMALTLHVWARVITAGIRRGLVVVAYGEPGERLETVDHRDQGSGEPPAAG